MVSALAISFSHSSSSPTILPHNPHHSPLTTAGPSFALSSSHYGMDQPISRPLERQWLLIDWLGLANTRTPTRWRAGGVNSSQVIPTFYLLTDRSRLTLYICSLSCGFLVWGMGSPISGALRIHTLERAFQYTAYLNYRARLCTDSIIISWNLLSALYASGRG